MDEILETVRHVRDRHHAISETKTIGSQLSGSLFAGTTTDPLGSRISPEDEILETPMRIRDRLL